MRGRPEPDARPRRERPGVRPEAEAPAWLDRPGLTVSMAEVRSSLAFAAGLAEAELNPMRRNP